MKDSPFCPVHIYHALIGLLQNLVPLGLRLLFGFSFMMSGWGKLQHFDKTAGFFKSIGIVAPAFNAAFIGGLELVGGALLIVGFGTRFFSLLLACTMVVALFTAHYQAFAEGLHGLMSAAPFSFLVATLALAAFGPGKVSVESVCGCHKGREKEATTTH